MRLSTSWDRLIQSKTGWKEQSRRENNGSKHRETMSINAEIVGDSADALPQSKQHLRIDKARITASIKFRREQKMHDTIRAAFGPRLVKSDGTARYTFQCRATARG